MKHLKLYSLFFILILILLIPLIPLTQFSQFSQFLSIINPSLSSVAPDKSMIYDRCVKVDNDTHALLATNIPIDARKTFPIGERMCSRTKGEMLAPTTGIYKFPIFKFLYDGIWTSNESICDDKSNIDTKSLLETQNWALTNRGEIREKENVYATNKFFPETVFFRSL